MKQFLSILMLVAVVAVITTSCTSGRNDTGRIFMPDMTYSNAYEAYASTKFQLQTDTDAISAMKPVNGSIARGYLPADDDMKSNDAMVMSYMFKDYFPNPLENRNLDDASERARAGQMLVNPFSRTDEVMADGKRLYNIYCAVCHGEKGAGNGSIVELPNGDDGPYTSRPPHYNTRLVGMTDGEIYYSIAYGKNMMGGYFSQVSAEDRWKLVHYVKDLGGIGETASVMNNENDGEEGDAEAMAMQNFDISEIEVVAGSEFNVPNIYYNTGSSDLKAESYVVLDQLKEFFESNDNVVVEIGSHADARGNYDMNMVLSSNRALSVVNYLEEHGVAANQLDAKGYGSSKPAVDCDPCTLDQHQQNRRTTFKIIEVN